MKYLISTIISGVILFSNTYAREWTSSTGKTVNAEFVEANETVVTLKRENDGKIFELPIEKLVEADIEFIQGQNKDAPDEVVENEENDEFIDTFEEDWPKTVSLKKDFEIEELEPEEGKFIYHSKHFEFIADKKLSKSVVKRFAETFEATLQYMQEIPISSQKALKHSDQEKKEILLFTNNDDYHAAGGPQGSAGVYMSRGNSERIMVKMSQLGLKKMASGFTLDRDKSNKTLPHEIAHMFTDPKYFNPGSRGWFTEGLAEYIAVTPYRGAKFLVTGNRGDIIDYVTAYGSDNSGGRNLKDEIQVGPLKDYMLLPYSEFADFTKNGNKHYGVGALIVYYFFHFDDKGSRKNINNFLQALQDGKQAEEALTILLGERTFEELEEDIHKEWRKRGIKLHF